MRFGIFDKFGAINSAPVFVAFCQGLERLGHSWSGHDCSADVAVIWSQLWAGRMRANQEIWNIFRDTSRPVIVLEVGMLCRGQTWKMGLNGVNRNAIWPEPCFADRWHGMGITPLPWRNQGSHILVALQRTDSAQWQGMPPLLDWVASTVNLLRENTDRPIVIRAHPRQKEQLTAMQTPKKLPNTYDDFDFVDAIKGAWCVVNWNSGPGCQAVINGVPVLVGESSLAAPVGTLDWSQVETPVCPDRTSWLNHIAHTEWTVEELASGVPIDLLLHRVQSC